MRAQPKSLPLLLIIGGAFGVVVIVLLLVIAFRGGKKRTGGPAPAPVVAGGAPYAAAGPYSVARGSEMKVGRDAAKCDISLTEPRISAVHATLKMEGGQLYVRDDQSNNGTFVDGHRLAPNVWTVAPTGGVLRFGPVEFNVRIGHRLARDDATAHRNPPANRPRPGSEQPSH